MNNSHKNSLVKNVNEVEKHNLTYKIFIYEQKLITKKLKHWDVIF